MNTFGYKNLRTNYGSFVVKNTTSPPKTICVFNQKIPFNTTKNLLEIPGVGEEDIRISLLKGQILNKILSGDIVIVSSDVNALNFNVNHRSFLLDSNLTVGTQIDSSILPYTAKRDITMVGPIDGYNAKFYCSIGDHFVVDGSYVVIIHWNGIRQIMNSDFYVDVLSRSSTVSNAYSAIYMAIPPSPGDILVADYYILNS